MAFRASPLVALALVLPLAGCLDTAGPGPSSGGTPTAPSAGGAAPPVWATLESATIRPGVQMHSPSGQCTSNFVFTSPDNRTVYLGFAAHCVGEGAPTDTDGCDPVTKPMALGTNVTIVGASRPARLAYTSWGTMQGIKEANPDICAYNDFAVVALDPADAGRVNPAMRHFGGPVGLASASALAMGDRVLTYGNSSLRPDQSPDEVNWHEGYVTEAGAAGGWSTEIYTVTPGVPGDSGSGVLSADGHALGDLVTIHATPHPLSNNFSSLDRELAYALQHAGLDLRLATAPLLDPGRTPSLP